MCVQSYFYRNRLKRDILTVLEHFIAQLGVTDDFSGHLQWRIKPARRDITSIKGLSACGCLEIFAKQRLGGVVAQPFLNKQAGA